MQAEQERFLIDDVFLMNDKPFLQKYIRTARLEGDSTQQEGINVEFDVNNDLYEMQVGEKHRIVLAQNFDKELDSNFKYVMYGKLFEIQVKEDLDMSVFCSFGGLICRFKGSQEKFSPNIRENLRVFIMMEKVE